MSQPNLSSSIKNLEDEIGITIFERNNRGVQVSQQGIEFLTYSRGILSQCEKIKNISKNKKTSKFRLITQNFSPVMESSVRFVKIKGKCEKVNFSLKNASECEVIDNVYKQESELGILFFHEDREEYIMKNI